MYTNNTIFEQARKASLQETLFIHMLKGSFPLKCLTADPWHLRLKANKHSTKLGLNTLIYQFTLFIWVFKKQAKRDTCLKCPSALSNFSVTWPICCYRNGDWLFKERELHSQWVGKFPRLSLLPPHWPLACPRGSGILTLLRPTQQERTKQLHSTHLESWISSTPPMSVSPGLVWSVGRYS